MSDINFIRGTFIQLEATTTIHLGRLERNISKGDVIEFDGTNIKYNGQEVAMPELKSGVKRGWLKVIVPVASQPVLIDQALEAKKQASVASKPKMEVQKVYDEEREVTSSLKKTEQAQPKKFPVQVDKREDDLRPVAKVESKSGASVAGHDETGVIMTEAGINLKTASKGKKMVLNDASSIDAELNKLENMTFQKNKFAVKKDEDAIVLKDEPAFNAKDVELALADSSVEDVKTVEALDSKPVTGAVEVGAPEGEFVWDKTLHWQGRAKLAVEKYKDQPELLEKVKAVESKGVIDLINKLMGVEAPKEEEIEVALTDEEVNS